MVYKRKHTNPEKFFIWLLPYFSTKMDIVLRRVNYNITRDSKPNVSNKCSRRLVKLTIKVLHYRNWNTIFNSLSRYIYINYICDHLSLVGRFKPDCDIITIVVCSLWIVRLQFTCIDFQPIKCKFKNKYGLVFPDIARFRRTTKLHTSQKNMVIYRDNASIKNVLISNLTDCCIIFILNIC